jgi:predicted nucleic acid-binding protein
VIVVSDTSPIKYLVLIEEIDLLPQLFGRVIIPQAVLDELQKPRNPRTRQKLDLFTHFFLSLYLFNLRTL